MLHFLSAAGPKLLKDLFSLVLGQFTSMVLGFVAFSYLARRLTTELYGTVEFVVSIAAFAAIVIECGVGMIAVREMARKDSTPSAIAAAAVSARSLIALIVAPLFATAAVTLDLPQGAELLILLYALSLLLAPLKQEWLLQSLERMRLAALGQPLRGLVFAIIVLALVGSSADLIWVGIAELGAVVALALYYVILQHALGVSFSWTQVSGRTLYYLREGLAIGLSNILWAFMVYAPIFLLLTLTQDAEASAWLGASQRLVIAMTAASFLYHFNIYPVVTRTVLHDRPKWKRIVHSSMHLVSWGGFGLAMMFSILAADVMALIFGDRFSSAGPVFATLVWAFPLRFLSGHARWSLVADGQQNWLLAAEIAGAIALLVTALIAIPLYSGVGAAIALLAGITVSGAITQFRAEVTLGRFGLASNVLQAAISGIAAVFIAVRLPASPAVQALSGLLLYLVFMIPSLKRLRSDLRRVSYAKAE